MLTFGTLGPSGSNHDWVAGRYLDFQGLGDARIELYLNFEDAIQSMLQGDIDHVIQVAVHPQTTRIVARYRGRAHVIDTFISPSQPMAVLTRAEIATARSLGLQMATADYIDTSRWQTLVAETSTVSVFQGLLEGKYDSGITLSRFADEQPRRFRVEETIGTVIDPWLVYGTTPTCGNDLLAWPDSPAAALFARSRPVG